MDLQLNEKKVFISGSTAGIGFGVAQSFLREGASVWINGRSESSVAKAIERLESEFPNAKVQGIAADFADKASIELLIQQLPEIDILINNVGIYSSQS
ncbi:MAG: SDR family NAD(P)-dependent oxidoreductase, partial [Bacteroidota bacterium]